MKATYLISASLLIILTISAQADPITIAIRADINDVWDPFGHLEGKITPGAILTGYYTYESTTADSNPLTFVGDYWHYLAPSGMFVTAGGFTFRTDPNSVQFLLEIGNDSPSGDDYFVSSYQNLSLENGVSVEDIFWQLNDPTGLALSSAALPMTAPIPSAWDDNYLSIGGGPRGMEFGIGATVTSATLVPEPATILLFATAIPLFRAFSP